MKPLKPEETVHVPGAATQPIRDYVIGLDPIPLPLPKPISEEVEILPLQEAP